MTGLEVTTTWEDDLCVLRLAGEARLETVQGFDRAAEEIESRGVPRVLVDMTRLAFMDSASTGSLLRLHSNLSQRGGAVVVFGLQRVTRRLFDRLGLDSLLVANDEAGARERFA